MTQRFDSGRRKVSWHKFEHVFIWKDFATVFHRCIAIEHLRIDFYHRMKLIRRGRKEKGEKGGHRLNWSTQANKIQATYSETSGKTGSKDLCQATFPLTSSPGWTTAWKIRPWFEVVSRESRGNEHFLKNYAPKLRRSKYRTIFDRHSGKIDAQSDIE